MSFCGSYSVPPNHCGSNYSGHSRSDDRDGSDDACHIASHDACGEEFWHVSALTVAWHDAAEIGAGVAGEVGCSDGGPCNDERAYHPPHPAGDGALSYGLASHLAIALADGAGDSILVTSGDANTLLAGRGAGDAITLETGDANLLQLGNGDGDILLVDTGNHNALHAGAGAGDNLLVLTGDNNCLSVGDGANANLSIGTGGSNDLEAGNGAGDVLSVGSGDNNLLHAGNGAGDSLAVGDGDHNTLCVGSGANDVLQIGTGDFNLLHSGDGNHDLLMLGTGHDDALIAGNGNGDEVIANVSDNSVLAVGNGTGDLINLELGNNNTILEGNGANDTILVGGQVGTIGAGTDTGNNVVIGNGNGDQAWGSLGNGNAYIAGAGNDLIHTGGGNDIVFGDNHTETATPTDPFHLIGTDSLAWNWNADGGNDTFILDGAQPCGCHGSGEGLGTTVMSGGGGAEKYWFDGLWGNAVITDFNTAHGDRITIGGATGADVAALGPVECRYVHSAYDASVSGNVDLLITFGSAANTAQSITLVDYKAQDPTGLFSNLNVGSPAAAEATLARIFDFSAGDDQAVAHEIAALSAQHLILH